MMTSFWFIILVKPGLSLLRPGIVDMRGQWSNDYGMSLHQYTQHTRS